MYICICNQIDEKMIEENPELIEVCGSQCGSCKKDLEESLKEKEPEGSN